MKQSSPNQDHHSVTPLEKMLAACSGALITSLFTTPFDVVKTRLQAQGISNYYNINNNHNNIKTSSFSSSIESLPSSYPSISLSPCRYPRRRHRQVFFSTRNLKQAFFCRLDPNLLSNQVSSSSLSCCALPPSSIQEVLVPKGHQKFNGILDGIIKIVRYEGVTSLWRGLSPSLVMSVPVTVIYFVGYDHLRDKLWVTWKGKHSETYSPLIAGATARTISASIVSPLELFRTRLQGPEGINGLKDVLKGVRVMVTNNGVSSLWRGLEPTLWRDVPFSAIYWTGYEFMKRNLKNYLHKNDLNGKANDFEVAFLCGATSGGFAALVTTPFDVAKTRRQIMTHQIKGGISMLNVMKTIVQDGGYKELFRGGTLRISRVAVSCALMISTYETLTNIIPKIS